MPSPRRKHLLKVARSKGRHTQGQWLAMCEALNHQCVRCRVPFSTRWPHWRQKDHIVPIAMGGSDCITNIQPLCWLCNTAKGHRDCTDNRPVDWKNLMLSSTSS